MITFKSYLLESATPSSPNPDMSIHAWNFLSHLSSPSDKTTKPLTEAVMEAKITIDHRVPGSVVRTGVGHNGGPEMENDSAHKSMNLPKSSAMIAKGNALIPHDANIHKRIAEGFKKHADEIAHETPEESKKKLRESKKVLAEFFKHYGYKKAPDLLNENGKTRKSSGEGVHTKGLTLAPHTTNGLKNFDVCPRASKECRANCLGTEAGGNRQFPDTSLSSKIAKTHALAMHPEHFARVLDHEIGQHSKKARKAGYIPGVRLNVDSDIAWEHHAGHIMKRHPETQFYDYTKMHNRVGHPNLPKNYHLTLSHTGTGHEESNDKHVVRALERGHPARPLGRLHPRKGPDGLRHLRQHHHQPVLVRGQHARGRAALVRLHGPGLLGPGLVHPLPAGADRPVPGAPPVLDRPDELEVFNMFCR